MYGCQQVLVHPNHELKAVLEFISQQANSLLNCGIYYARQLYFKDVQYVTVGNLSDNDKAFLFLMDYRHRKRLKLWGRAKFVEGDPILIERLRVPGYQAEIERVILFQIEAWNWNCPLLTSLSATPNRKLQKGWLLLRQELHNWKNNSPH